MVFINTAPRWALACATVSVASALAGCERSTTPASMLVEQQNDTPEAQLRYAMRRLKDALDRARADSSSGIVSTRRCQYRLISPKDDSDAYTARVTIETTIGLNPQEISHRDAPPEEGRKVVPIADVAEAAENVSSVEKRTYKLVYLNERWELDEPLPQDMPETERLCFQFALSAG